MTRPYYYSIIGFLDEFWGIGDLNMVCSSLGISKNGRFQNRLMIPNMAASAQLHSSFLRLLAVTNSLAVRAIAATAIRTRVARTLIAALTGLCVQQCYVAPVAS